MFIKYFLPTLLLLLLFADIVGQESSLQGVVSPLRDMHKLGVNPCGSGGWIDPGSSFLSVEQYI